MSEPFLTNLGVLERDQVYGPSIDNMPGALNATCKQYWVDAVNAVSKLDIINGVEAWMYAVKTFVQLCIENNEYPFLQDPDTVNSRILSSMKLQRAALVKFLMSTPEFSAVLKTLPVSGITRDVIFVESGFIIACTAKIRWSFLDAVDLCSKLSFYRVSDYCYRLSLGSGITLEISANLLEDARYTNLSYTMTQDYLPYISNNYTPTEQEYKKFILDVMYIPLIRLSAPTIFSSRLF